MADPVVHARLPAGDPIAAAAFRRDPSRPNPIVSRYPDALPENIVRHRPAAADPRAIEVRPALEVRTVVLQPAPPRPLPPDGEPRSALRAALIAKGDADAAVGRAREALGRAAEIVDEAVAALSATQAAERSTISTAGAALRAWLVGGAVGDRPQPGASPSDRAAAENVVAAAIVARDSLLADLESAEGRLLQVEQRIAGAVQAIILGDALADVDKITELFAEVTALQRRLVGLPAVTFSFGAGRLPEPIKLPAPVRELLRDRDPQAGDSDARAAWQSFASRLREDPDALFSPAEPAPPAAA